VSTPYFASTGALEIRGIGLGFTSSSASDVYSISVSAEIPGTGLRNRNFQCFVTSADGEIVVCSLLGTFQANAQIYVSLLLNGGAGFSGAAVIGTAYPNAIVDQLEDPSQVTIPYNAQTLAISGANFLQEPSATDPITGYLRGTVSVTLSYALDLRLESQVVWYDLPIIDAGFTNQVIADMSSLNMGPNNVSYYLHAKVSQNYGFANGGLSTVIGIISERAHPFSDFSLLNSMKT
jgi:hypothetical protein